MSRVKELAENKEKILVEVHMIKSYPASHLNADDVGALKTTVFGGYERARISSQCLKNAMRQSDEMKNYSKGLSGEEESYRTRKLETLVMSYMRDKYKYDSDESEESIREMDKKVVHSSVSSIVGNEKGVAGFISTEDVKFIAELIHQNRELIETEIKKEKKKKDETVNVLKNVKVAKVLENYKKENGMIIPAIINLFGRMSTSDAINTIDSAMSVAHAISTHEVIQDSDYFSAIDDLTQIENETGASHINTTSFNSACYYLYANMDINQFCRNMEKNITDEKYKENALKGIVETFLNVVCMEGSQTKKTSFASTVLPDCVYVTVKNKSCPYVLANAFENPVTGESGGYLRESVDRLAKEADILHDAYPTGIVESFWLCPRYDDLTIKSANKVNSLSELAGKITQLVLSESVEKDGEDSR